MARSYVARELVKLGGDPVYREGVITDNANVILDVFNMKITHPKDPKARSTASLGCDRGSLCSSRADVVITGTPQGGKSKSNIGHFPIFRYLITNGTAVCRFYPFSKTILPSSVIFLPKA